MNTMYAWGNNDGYLGNGITDTPNPGPIRPTFDIPAYKIKDIVVQLEILIIMELV